jgi:hypothetical protein
MMYEGNPSRRDWLDAMHPFGGYTAEKQRVYVDALTRAQCRFDVERDPGTKQIVAYHCTCGLDTTDPGEALRHAKTARPNSWSLCFVGAPS